MHISRLQIFSRVIGLVHVQFVSHTRAHSEVLVEALLTKTKDRVETNRIDEKGNRQRLFCMFSDGKRGRDRSRALMHVPTMLLFASAYEQRVIQHKNGHAVIRPWRVCK